ncbi:MAG: hypothetical protein EPO26_10540 [Chloroflexota bacterium]|nr:MAG: hypothetical protein EPO26_10540 [Chloroflexota bacterium]
MFFAGRSARIEANPRNATKPEIGFQNLAYVIGCIHATHSFLESTINRFYFDAGQVSQGILTDRDITVLAPEVLSRLDGAWKLPDFERTSCLDKYDLALLMAGNAAFDHGSDPYQSIALIIKLRNELVHTKAQWVEVASTGTGKSRHRFETQFRGRFRENQLTWPKAVFYPNQLLGFGCAEWCVLRSISFVESFYTRAGGHKDWSEFTKLLTKHAKAADRAVARRRK